METDFMTKQEAQELSIAACEKQIEKLQDLITDAAEQGTCTIAIDAGSILEGTIVDFRKLGYAYDSYDKLLSWDK